MTETSVALKRQAPGPANNLLLSTLLGSRSQDLLGFWLDMWREYGDIVRVRMGPMVLHQIVRPEHVRHVLCALSHQGGSGRRRGQVDRG